MLKSYRHHFADQNRITIFEREAGVVRVEAPNVIPNRRTVDDVWGFVKTLETSGLEWVWEREQSDFEERGPTVLSLDTELDLIDDLREREHEHFWRSATLVGVDPGRADEIADPIAFAPALRQFATTEQGPVRIVIFLIGDTHEQFVFLPHTRVAGVETLLAQLGIDPEAVTRRRDYRASCGITLEALYRAL